MADVVNPQVVDSVTIDNVKTIAGAASAAQAQLYSMAAHAAGLAIQNATGQQHSLNVINQALITQAVNKLLNIDVEEAVATLKATSGNDLAQQLSALLTALNSGQQGVKSAGNTPPPTI